MGSRQAVQVELIGFDGGGGGGIGNSSMELLCLSLSDGLQSRGDVSSGKIELVGVSSGPLRLGVHRRDL
jgi:hypothetical protein